MKKKLHPDDRTSNGPIDLAAERARRQPVAIEPRHDPKRNLLRAAGELACSPRSKDRELAQLVLAGAHPSVRYEALRIARTRLELSAAGRPFWHGSRGGLPSRAGVDERLRDADRLIREAGGDPERLPRPRNDQHGLVLRVCVAAKVAEANALPEERDALFRRWLAETECDLARSIKPEDVAALCEAFAGPKVSWKNVMPVVGRLGFLIDEGPLKTLFGREMAKLRARASRG